MQNPFYGNMHLFPQNPGRMHVKSLFIQPIAQSLLHSPHLLNQISSQPNQHIGKLQKSPKTPKIKIKTKKNAFFPVFSLGHQTPSNNKQANRGNSYQLHQSTNINSSQKSLIIMLLVVSIYRIHLSLLYHSLPFRGGFFPFLQLISLHYHSPPFLSRHLLFTCLPLPLFHPL